MGTFLIGFLLALRFGAAAQETACQDTPGQNSCKAKGHSLLQTRSVRSRSEEEPTSNSMATSTTTATAATPTLNTTENTSAATTGPSIFCFAVMMPFGYEPELLGVQLAHGLGVFSCDGYGIFSNVSMYLGRWNRTGPHVGTNLVEGGSLLTPVGGKWYTALNTGVFIRAWEAVVRQGSYLHYKWTVKADLDSVFFPERLRGMLQQPPMADTAPGKDVSMFLNNCDKGFHGPLEVLSRGAVTAFSESGHRLCNDMERLPWGEDTFMDHCLLRLGARRVDEFSLLSEEACHSPHPVPCETASVAFHPFKTSWDWMNCSSRAMRFGVWP